MTSGLRSAFNFGLLGGVVAWHACLVGMVESFSERRLIGETVELSYVWLVGIVLLIGYLKARNVQAPGIAVFHSIVSGATIGAALTLLALLTSVFNLRDIFPFASPRLVELLTLERGIADALGLLFPILGGAVLGAAAGGLALAPPIWRRTITVALLVTVLIGLLRDIFAAIVPRDVVSLIFTSRGLLPMGALVVFVVSGALTWLIGTFGLPGISTDASSASRSVATPWKYAYLGFGVLFLLTFPLWGKLFLSNVANFIGLYIIMALGLSLVIGFAGMLDLGFVAFFAIGAYTMAILTSPKIGTFTLTFWQALPFSMLFAFLSGVVLGLPVLRMRGDYLAIATLGFGEIIRILALSNFLKPYMGGAQGITSVARPEIAGFVISKPEPFYYIVLIGCVVAWFVAARLKHSRLGRAWMAIREDEDVAQAMGINRVETKLLAFAIGAILGGMSGAFFAGLVGSVVPKSFELLVSINVLAVIIVGGMGSLPGVLVGALVLVGLPELLREFAEYRMLVYGAVLVVMMLFRPEGLWPEAVRKRELHKDETSAPQRVTTSVTASTTPSVKD